jgi:hypothetical protein
MFKVPNEYRIHDGEDWEHVSVSLPNRRGTYVCKLLQVAYSIPKSAPAPTNVLLTTAQLVRSRLLNTPRHARGQWYCRACEGQRPTRGSGVTREARPASVDRKPPRAAFLVGRPTALPCFPNVCIIKHIPSPARHDPLTAR